MLIVGRAAHAAVAVGQIPDAGDAQLDGGAGKFLAADLGQRAFILTLVALGYGAGIAVGGDDDMYLHALRGIAGQSSSRPKAFVVGMGKNA